MNFTMRSRFVPSLSGAVLFLVSLVWYFQSAKHATASPVSASATSVVTSVTNGSRVSADLTLTNVYAHNLMLRKGQSFRVYVRWLRGQMVRVDRNVNPSFDEPEAFVLDIEKRAIHTNVADLTNFLNDSLAKSSLRNIALACSHAEGVLVGD